MISTKLLASRWGLSIKDVHSQRDCPVRIFWCILADISRADKREGTPVLFGAKKLRIFWNLWCVRTDKGDGLNQSDILRSRGRRGLIFRDFVRTSLWTAPCFVRTNCLGNPKQAAALISVLDDAIPNTVEDEDNRKQLRKLADDFTKSLTDYKPNTET